MGKVNLRLIFLSYGRSERKGLEMFQVLMVEDSRNAARLMRDALERVGYEVFEAANGAEALALLDVQRVDIIVLDVMMPVMDGYEFTEKLRYVGDMTPILMVTAKDLPEERCRGFIAGTDDYMVKPINTDELVLRIRALLRRARIASERKLRVGDVVLDCDELAICRNSERYDIPQKEFQLLYKLLSYPGQIFTRHQLMEEIWGRESDSLDTTINVHVARLRQRFGEWDEFDIKTVRGLGYKAVVRDGR